MQSQKAVSAYLKSKQILPFGFAWQYGSTRCSFALMLETRCAFIAKLLRFSQSEIKMIFCYFSMRGPCAQGGEGGGAM